MVLDLVLAFYPLYIIGRLQQMKRSTKVSLCLIMCGGLMYVGDSIPPPDIVNRNT